MRIVSKVGILSFAKIQACMMFIFGLLFGGLYAALFLIIGIVTVSGGKEREGYVQIGMAVFFAIGFPIIYTIMGFVLGALAAFVYNIAARKIGGIELELTEPTAPAIGVPGDQPIG
jgi:hypothetical protein